MALSVAEDAFCLELRNHFMAKPHKKDLSRIAENVI